MQASVAAVAQAVMTEAGLPQNLIERLSRGR
jgi:hypothetical protein